MNKLSQFFKNVLNKWKGISKKKKIAFIILLVGILAALIVLIKTTTTTKYAVLYSKMDSTDAATIMQKLDDDKITHKEDSTTNTIYVPASEVDKLRLEYSTSIKNGSTGFELFDNSSGKFGTTDAEFNVEYQRALQGEIERSIKSLDGVDDARVSLVLPQDSVFVKDSTSATASVTIKMKTGESLSKSQVMAIISLVSGSVKNLPKENVTVIDDKMNLLSKDLYKSNTNDNGTTSADDRTKAEQQVESDDEKKALDALESVYGKGKVKVKVNATLNFDAQETDSQSYYNNPTNQKDTRNPVVVSQHTTNSSSTGTNGSSGSPTSNNTSSNTITNSTGNSTSTSTDTTTNYDVSSDTTKTVKSPGDVKRLTISVVVDGTIDSNTQNDVSNIVGNAVGFDNTRGDSISVVGMPFDKTAEKNAQKALNDMQKAEQAAQNQRLYIGLGIGGVVLLGLIAFLVIRAIKKRKAAKALEAEEAEDTEGLDVLIGDEEKENETQKFAPINFETEDVNSHIEKEIKKYATTKPEQVVDIIKAWLSNEER